MIGLHSAILGVVVALLAGATIYWLFGIRGRRHTESSSGIESLATLKWRDFAHLVLEALRRNGYVEQDVERQPGDSGFDFVLNRDGQRYLLACKHGRAYLLGEQAVREFATAIRMQSADGGIIATLGNVEGFAREIADAHRIELIDGTMLWPRVAVLMAPEVREEVMRSANERINRSLMLGAIGSLGLGVVAMFLAASLGLDASARIAAQRAENAPVVAAPPPRPHAAQQANGNPAGEAEPMDEQMLHARRASAMQRIDQLPTVSSAIWSTRSTLVLSLRATGEDIFDQSIDEACAVLVEYEELRYTRLQLEPPETSDQPVRWRQCR